MGLLLRRPQQLLANAQIALTGDKAASDSSQGTIVERSHVRPSDCPTGEPVFAVVRLGVRDSADQT